MCFVCMLYAGFLTNSMANNFSTHNSTGIIVVPVNSPIKPTNHIPWHVLTFKAMFSALQDESVTILCF